MPTMSPCAALEDLLGELARADFSDRDDGRLQTGISQRARDACGDVEVRAVGVRGAGHAAIAGVSRVRVERLAFDGACVFEFSAGRERDVIGAGTSEANGDRSGVEHRVAVANALVADESNADGKIVADRLAHALRDTQRKAQAILERAAVLVAPRVEAREKRRQRVRVRHVELDAVEAALVARAAPRARRRRRSRRCPRARACRRSAASPSARSSRSE